MSSTQDKNELPGLRRVIAVIGALKQLPVYSYAGKSSVEVESNPLNHFVQSS